MNRLILNMIALVAIVLGGLGLFMYGIDNLVNPAHPTYEKSVAFAASGTNSDNKDYNNGTALGNLNKINVNADVGEVKVEFVPDGENRVEWKGRAPQSVIDRMSKVEIDPTGTLSLDFSIKEQWKDTPFLDFGGRNYEHTIIIHASPEFVLEQLHSYVAAGDVAIEGLHVNQLTAGNSIGTLTVKNVKGQTVDLQATTGDVVAVDVDAKLQVSSTLGNVQLINTKQTVDVNIVTGDLVVEQDMPHSVDAGVTLGNIVIKAAPGFGGRVKAHSTLGNVTLPNLSGNGDLMIQARTETGNVTVVQK